MHTRLSYRRFVVALLAALVVTALPAVAAAQATRGTILGTITDQTGAAMPGVTVIATETRTNISHETVTNETGNFTLPNIPDGIYNIKAELQGFKTVVREAYPSGGQHQHPRRPRALGGRAGGNRDGVGRNAAPADGSHRHGAHAGEHPGGGHAAVVQPEFSRA